MGIILVIAAIAIIAWLWNDTLKARERMLRYCRRTLDTMDMQLLDETVAIHHVGLRRNQRGQMMIARTYHFDFSIDGQDRWPGQAILFGQRVETLRIEHPDGLIIVDDHSKPELLH